MWFLAASPREPLKVLKVLVFGSRGLPHERRTASASPGVALRVAVQHDGRGVDPRPERQAAARLRAAPSRSITARQPGLTWARFLTMQAVIRWTLGTSWPHSRMASPVHICCASEKARPGPADSAVAAQAMAKRSAILLV